MIPVPHPAWLDAASGVHAPRWRVDLLDRAGQVVYADVPFIDGAVSIDAERRTAVSVDVPSSAVPTRLDARYLPMGGRVRVSWRLDPWPDWIVVADCDQAAAAIARPESVWTIAAADQAGLVALDDMARGGVNLGSGTVGSAIANLIRRTLPGAPVTVAGRAATAPLDRDATATATGSPWQLVQSLAESAGAVAWQDPSTRMWRVRDRETVGTPVDHLHVAAGGQLTGYTINHELTVNTAVIRWESDADPPTVVTGRWEDRRASSPVAVQRIGTHIVAAESYTRVPAAQMPTQARADAAAAALGQQRNARMRSPELRHPCRPWLQPGDTVTVGFLGGPDAEPALVESVGIGMTRDNIQVTRLRNMDYEVGEVPAR